MISDFTPIVHTLEGRTIRVWAVADVHIGAKECDLDGFKAFCGKCKMNLTATSEEAIYIKKNGSWVQYSKIYKKINGS